jgi:hypothetical protein
VGTGTGVGLAELAEVTEATEAAEDHPEAADPGGQGVQGVQGANMCVCNATGGPEDGVSDEAGGHAVQFATLCLLSQIC